MGRYKSILIILIIFQGLIIERGLADGQGSESLNLLELQFLGQKYNNEPLQKRIGRLETSLQTPPPPAVTDHYRLARLQAYSQTHVSREAEQLAVEAYNRGVDETAEEAYDQAIASYQEALNHNPHMTQAYNNLANLYEKMQRVEEAVQAYEKALQYAPNDPLLHRNLGVMYERTGDVRKALEEFKTYLKLAPEGADPAIASIVEEFNQRMAEGDTSADYLDAATKSSEGNRLSWPARVSPVPVYIHLEDSEQIVYLPMVQESMRAWEAATGERLKFQEVSSPGKARILITLREGPLAHPYLNVGHAQYQASGDRKKLLDTLKVSININTGEQGHHIPFEQQSAQVKRLALHEIGHAIGIWGHSTNPRDIMYSHPIASGLSGRDVETARKLYETGS
jgi:tetratricopeptide (TPR) repeat protein